jgi:hypothetical protein
MKNYTLTVNQLCIIRKSIIVYKYKLISSPRENEG